MSKPAPSSPVSSVVSEIKVLSSRSKAIREKMNALNLEIATLRETPVSLDDFQKYLRLWVERCGQVYAEKLMFQNFFYTEAGREPANKLSLQELERVAGTKFFFPFPRFCELQMGQEPTINALCYFMPEMVFEKLFAEMKARCHSWGNTEAMPIAERMPRIEALTREVEKLRPELNAVDSEISKIQGLIADAKN